jgi:quercetin dioxygenase-like cupin family protein
MVEEARLESVESGLAPVTAGWFVVNARDAAWLSNDYFGGVCIFEADDFVLRGRPDLDEYIKPGAGFILRVFKPGKPSSFYHAERVQEDFLVLVGECFLLIEGEERLLRTWDFVHCPPGTAHTFVGAGDCPCVILATGNRTDDHQRVYPRSDLARRHGAGVETETTSGAEAYASFGEWRLERPERWNELPWAV